MTAEDERVIPDILQEHYDELAFLWGQRQTAVRSPRCTLRDLRQMEERISAHADGLVIGGGHALPVLKEGLAASKSAAFAAAYPLLLMRDMGAGRLVIEAFLAAKGGGLDGLQQALCHGPTEFCLADLRRVLADAPPERLLAAAIVLAFHRQLDGPANAKIEQLVQNEQPEIRQKAWG